MKPDKYRNHTRNRRTKRKKRAWLEDLKEKYFEIFFWGKFTVSLLVCCLLPVLLSIPEFDWLVDIIPALKKSDVAFTILYMLNFFLGSIVFIALFSDVPSDNKKSIRKAMGKEPLSINIPDYSYNKKYPEFEKQLKEEKFTNYIRLNGHESKYLKISENDKWICICDQYYPMDLIYGYPSDRDSFYTIKGDAVKFANKNIPEIARQELFEFFKKKGNIIDIDPGVVKYLYRDLDYRGMYNVEKANWAGLRLAWEEAVAQRKHPKVSGKNYKATDEDGKINTELFDRVLSNSELGRVTSALSQKAISPSDVFVYDRYVNEYTVCNAIKLAEFLRNNYKDETLDFLFKCLGDIDEAYFHRAATVILKYPHNMIKERLEEQALSAFKAQDALHLAGLLYIAKEIDYEISCLKEIKESKGGSDTFSQLLQLTR